MAHGLMAPGGYQAAAWSRQIASGIPPWFDQLLARSAWQWQDGDGRTGSRSSVVVAGEVNITAECEVL
jgi:hypothetical protein